MVNRGLVNCLLAVGLVVICGFASFVEGRIVSINALPFTFTAADHSTDTWDTLVVAGTKLTSSGSGIVLASSSGSSLHNVVLNLASDTVVFGTESSDLATGVYVDNAYGNTPYNIKILGGNLIHQPSDTTADSCWCVRISGHDIYVDSINMEVRGFNGRCVYIQGRSVYNVELAYSKMWSGVTGFSNRCQYNAPVVKATDLYSSSLSSAGALYHVSIHDNTITDGPWMGIAVLSYEGSGNYAKSLIYNNRITTDARNDFYLSYSGTCYSSSNPYGIGLRHVAAGTQCYNNTIRSGNERGGNRGILIEYGNGTADEPIEIFGNNIDVHEGPNVEYGSSLPLHGMRIRYRNRYLHVYNNTIIGTGDNLSSTTAYGSIVHALRYSWAIDNAHNLFEHNHIIAKANTPGVTMEAVTMEFDDVASSYHDTTTHFIDNRIESQGTLLQFGNTNGGGGGMNFSGDTLSFLSPTYSPETFSVGWLGNGWDCEDNSATDLVYENNASYDDIHFSSGGTADMTIRKTIRLTVRGNNDIVIPGATVAIRNGYGHQVASGLTNSAGKFAAPVTYLFESRTSADSTAFNDFTVSVQKGSDQASQTVEVTPTMSDLTLQLSNTSGVVDSDPPGPITSLFAATGSGEGRISLSWTSSGDDGSTGTASFYSIKYSTSSITTSNFDAIPDSMTNPPLPEVSGTQQSTVLANLVPNTKYFVAIKAYDDGMNPSPISNIASAISSFSLPVGDTTGPGSSDMVVTLLVPEDGATINSTHPVLSARNIGASGSNSYYFEVAENASFSPLVASSPGVPQTFLNFTFWTVDTALAEGQSYYWRVRVNGYPYSDAVQFTVGATSDVVAYPNPVSFLQGESVTFVLPPTGPVDLLIQTSAGETVIHPTNLSGQYVWDGRNESGNPVAVGVFLWYIEGTSYKGKIVNVP